MLRYAAFAREYAKDHNGTRAYRAVYPNCKSENAAAVGAHQFLRNPKIRALVDDLEAEAARAAQIDIQRLLREAARLAFVDSRKLFHPDGRPKEPQELDDDTAAAVGGIERVVEYHDVPKKNGRGTTKRKTIIYRYKVLDKNSSLERLFKHKGLFRPETDLPPIEDLESMEEEDVVGVARRIAFTLELAGRRGKAKIKATVK